MIFDPDACVYDVGMISMILDPCCDVVNLHMRRRRPFLQEMTAFSEKMMVAARLMVNMMIKITMSTMMTFWLMMTGSPLGS